MRARQPWNSDLIALLWEVKRLRSIVLRLYQLRCEFRRPIGALKPCYDELIKMIETEPCVLERNADAVDILARPESDRRAAPQRQRQRRADEES